ncbi:MAG: VWA domain-containing protein, partial [Gammaproteobacteria bacterium]|nr:VWA domain-containing protein [Gammaproteobacteria bacterium]
MSFDLSMLHFLRPEWLLAIIPLLLLSTMLWRLRVQKSGWRKVVDPELLPYLLEGDASRGRYWPVMLVTLGGILACIAMAGPTWERLPQPIFRNDAALVLVLDLSKSMDAQDIKPSRLQRARFKIADILKARQEGQTALIVYAADAFTVTPLTDDDDTILSQLPALTTDLVPVQGSRADIALEMANQLLKQASQTRGQVLLITDEMQTARGIEAAQNLLKAGYQLSILGVGTAAGAPIPVGGGMLKNSDGEIVVPRLDSTNLRRIASTGKGRYATISGSDSDIRQLDIADVGTSEDSVIDTEDMTTDRWREAGPWLLLPLILLAPLAFRRGILILACVILLPLPQPAQAFEWRDLWQTPDQRAQQLFQQEKISEAAQQFKDPAWRASANYQSDNFEQALQDFQSLEGADARYNEGNTLARIGKLKEALKAYDQAIEQQPEHEDAIHNRKLVEEQLKQQQQQQQQQQQ